MGPKQTKIKPTGNRQSQKNVKPKPAAKASHFKNALNFCLRSVSPSLKIFQHLAKAGHLLICESQCQSSRTPMESNSKIRTCPTQGEEESDHAWANLLLEVAAQCYSYRLYQNAHKTKLTTRHSQFYDLTDITKTFFFNETPSDNGTFF